jgi:REP element-mobilizing transposase RayT
MAARTPQLGFQFRTWGGKRKGAGRPPKGEKAGMPHDTRPVFRSRVPVHVTLRMRRGIWNLRAKRCFVELSKAFWNGAVRRGFKLVQYSVQGNHIHLIIEAGDNQALSQGMNALNVRIARALNRVMGRKGSVLKDRYHAHILRTPTEVRRARNYLLTNAQRHYNWVGPDPFTSSTFLAEPETFLLRRRC